MPRSGHGSNWPGGFLLTSAKLRNLGIPCFCITALPTTMRLAHDTSTGWMAASAKMADNVTGF